jgi:hypothetical protein
MSAPTILTVLEAGRPIAFTYADLMLYHGHGFPGGVAHAFAAMAAAFPLLDHGQPLERREITIRTAFRGPGGHDALEMVTRARTDGRFEVAPDLSEPQRGTTLQNYVFAFTYRGRTVTVHVAEGIVRDEFIALGKQATRTATEEARLEVLKQEMADRILGQPPAAVYSPV